MNKKQQETSKYDFKSEILPFLIGAVGGVILFEVVFKIVLL